MRKAITKRGAVISEYPPDTPAKPYHFPARNRMIAALSQGVLIIESGKHSGSLITADFALEQGKELFALLGNNSSNNEGSNERIKEGTAIPVTDFMDIVLAFRGRYFKEEKKPIDITALADAEDIPVKHGKRAGKRHKEFQKPSKEYSIDEVLGNQPEPEKPKRQSNVNLTGDESKVYQCLSAEPVHIDTIVRESKLPVFRVLGALTQLEMKGLTVSSQGRKFSLK